MDAQNVITLKTGSGTVVSFTRQEDNPGLGALKTFTSANEAAAHLKNQLGVAGNTNKTGLLNVLSLCDSQGASNLRHTIQFKASQDSLYQQLATQLVQGNLFLYVQTPSPASLVPSDTAASAPPPKAKAEPNPGGQTSDSSDSTGSQASSTQGTNAAGKKDQANSNKICQSDPVAMSSGEEILELLDFELDGPMPIRWIRSYRSSQCFENIGMGHGWRSNFHLQLLEVMEVLEEKDKHKKPQLIELLLIDEEGRRLPFTPVSVGETSYQLNEGLALHHEDNGSYRLVRPDNTHWSFVRHNEVWVLDRISDSHGNQQKLFYSKAGRLTRIDLSPTRGIELSYDHSGHLTHIHAATRTDKGIQRFSEPLALYQYNTNNDLVEGTDAQQRTERYHYQDHLFTQRVRSSGFSHYFEWEGEGPAARCVHNWGDDGRYDYHFEYVDDERLAISTDGRGQVWKFWHDTEGRLIAKQSPSNHRWQYEFDEHGQKVSETTPTGGVTRYTYNDNGQLVSLEDASGAKTQYQYNGLGQRIVTIDATGGVWQREYSVAGHLKNETRPNGAKTHYHYNEQSQLIEIQRQDASTIKYLWNEEGQLLARQLGDDLIRYSYDELGRLNGTLDVSGLVTQYERDSKGQLTQIKQFEQNNPEDTTEQHYHYDDSGRLVQQTDAKGLNHRYEYEGLSQPTKQIRPDGSWLHYQYDNERNLTGIERSDGTQYQIEYDGEELPVKLTGFDGRQQTQTYDGEGHLIESDDCGEKGVRLKRDALGRVTEQIGRDLKTQETHSNHFQYDPLGRVTFANNADRKLRYKYNSNGQITENWQDQWQTQHDYDLAGRRMSTQLPDGQTVQYRYDKHGRLNQVGLNDQPLMMRKFDQQGREIQRECSNGVLVEQAFDAFGKLSSQVWHNQDNDQETVQETSQQRSYQYKRNQLIAIEDNELGSKCFKYDELDQLLEVEGKTSERFEWDSFGNPIGPDSEVKNDRLIKQNGTNYRYDPCGNQIQAQTDLSSVKECSESLSQTRDFDGFNQLRRLKNNGKVNHYQYDALGRRSAKLTEQGKTDFLWDGDQLIGEHNNGLFRWYIYEPNSFLPIALVENGQVYQYHLDHLGTPIKLTDSQGETAWTACHSAFGVADVTLETIINPIRFQGQYYDQESGLHYNRFRYYDPKIGRFIHQDPIGLVGGINHYQYVPNPVQWVDPFGLSCKEGSTKNPIFAGHGEINPRDTFIIPVGTTLTLYSLPGAVITDDLGQLIEAGTPPEGIYKKTYLPSDVAPDLILQPNCGQLNLSENSYQVKDDTHLRNILEPNMGDCHWAACTYIPEHKNSNLIFHTSGVFREKSDGSYEELSAEELTKLEVNS